MQHSVSMPIEHIDPNELALFISDDLPRNRVDDIKAHVHTCTACEERLVTGLLSRINHLNDGSLPVDNRTAKRLERNETGYLQAISPLSFDRHDVQIVDGSDGGLGLLTQAHLEPGTIIQVCVGLALALGEVRACQPIGNGMNRIGVQVQSSAKLHGNAAAH